MMPKIQTNIVEDLPMGQIRCFLFLTFVLTLRHQNLVHDFVENQWKSQVLNNEVMTFVENQWKSLCGKSMKFSESILKL
jgi:hypothetical protein